MIIFGTAPAQPHITVVGDTLYSSHACGYQWYFNGSPIAGVTDSFYVAVSSGTYAVRIIVCIGCSSISNGVPLSVKELSNQEIKVFPNPSTGRFTIFLDKISYIKVYNYLGELVFEENNVSYPQKEINLNAAKGIYLIKISDGQ